MKKVTQFSERIKEAQNDSGLTSTQLANLLDCDKSLITLYRKGKTEPKEKHLQKLGEILHVNPVWLMGYDVPKSRVLLELKSKILNLVDSMDLDEIKEVENLCNEILKRRK